MQIWEYAWVAANGQKILESFNVGSTANTTFDELLSGLGNEGWELVGLGNASYLFITRLFFKRAKTPQSS
jgi:hypothetical protein